VRLARSGINLPSLKVLAPLESVLTSGGGGRGFVYLKGRLRPQEKKTKLGRDGGRYYFLRVGLSISWSIERNREKPSVNRERS